MSNTTVTMLLNWIMIVVPVVVALGISGLCVYLLYVYRVVVGKAIGVGIQSIATAIATLFRVIWKNYTGILTFIKTKLFTRAAYFRGAVLACMVISISHGAHLFSTSQNATVLGLLDMNTLLSATIDIGIWVLIEGMISTRKRGYVGASFGILVGIVGLCVLSFVANLTFNQHYYEASLFSGVNASVMPYVTLLQSSPPIIIIFMSMVAELFVKADVVEEVTYKSRLQKKYQHHVDKLEAKLSAEKMIADTRNKYSTKLVQEEKLTPQIAVQQPVKWSLFGLLKVYETTPATPTLQPEIIDTLQKITVTIVSVQQTINQLPSIVQASIQPQLEQATNSMLMLSQTVERHTTTRLPVEETPVSENMHMHNSQNNQVVEQIVETPTTLQETQPIQTLPNPVTNPRLDIDTGLLKLVTIYPDIASWIRTERTTVGIADVEQAIHMKPSDVRKLIKAGTLEVSPFKPDAIKVRSLFSWLQEQKLAHATA